MIRVAQWRPLVRGGIARGADWSREAVDPHPLAARRLDRDIDAVSAHRTTHVGGGRREARAQPHVTTGNAGVTATTPPTVRSGLAAGQGPAGHVGVRVNQFSLFGGAEDDPAPKPIHDGTRRLRVLITVKAAPNPSEKYGETVCVAGYNMDIEAPGWIRLYPINFRELTPCESFKKYDVVEVDAVPARQDPRSESWRPRMNTLQVVDHERLVECSAERLPENPAKSILT